MEKKVYNDVKSIEFDVYFEGKGCVNYDGDEQKNTLINLGLLKGKNMYAKNKKFAKKVFEPLESNPDNENSPKAKFKYKVSSDCLRHAMYKDEMEFMNPSISYIPSILFNAIAQPSMIERGYMFASSNSTIRKKSVFTITDAVEEGEWHTVVDFDLHSRSGEKQDGTKQDDNNSEDKGSLSLSFCENVGNHEYKASGFIDLTELQFISADPIYDRAAVIADGGEDEKAYLTALRNNFGEGLKLSYYYMKNALTEDEWAEKGVLLGKEAVDKMTKDIIKRIYNINIYRRDATFNIEGIRLKVNYGDEKVVKEEIVIPSLKYLDQFEFNYCTKYFSAEAEKIEKNCKMADEAKKTQKSKK